MDDAVEESKELLNETVRAFKTGLRGQDYVPGSGGSPEVRRDDELAKLEELRESGTLSDDEYHAARLRLLHPDTSP